MTASGLAGIIAGTIFFGAGALSGFVSDPFAKKALYFMALAAIVWYIWKGHDLKGWIGDSYADMLKEIERLDSLSANWHYSNGQEVPIEKRQEILKRHQRLIEKIQFHPDNPRNRT